MRQPLYILLFIFIASGCVETAEVSLKKAEPRLVVEGTIENSNGPFEVQLSLSTDLYTDGADYVEDAAVKLSDNVGNVENLTHKGSGKYATQSMSGVSGRTYHLEINYLGQYFEAWTTLPEQPHIDTIDVVFYEESALREEGYYLVIKELSSDIATGYYRAMVYKGDSLLNPLGSSDLFAAIVEEDGNGIKKIDIPFAFEKEEVIRIEIVSMDKAAYIYYQSYLLMLYNDGGLFGSPPANPESNISNGAMGLFKAVAVLEREVVVE